MRALFATLALFAPTCLQAGSMLLEQSLGSPSKLAEADALEVRVEATPGLPLDRECKRVLESAVASRLSGLGVEVRPMRVRRDERIGFLFVRLSAWVEECTNRKVVLAELEYQRFVRLGEQELGPATFWRMQAVGYLDEIESPPTNSIRAEVSPKCSRVDGLVTVLTDWFRDDYHR